VSVRPLGVEDFDDAEGLIRQGEDEGYLAPRTDEQVDDLLSHCFGAFVEELQLAGIGSLRLIGGAGELCSLYTLTRFIGEGVGKSLVEFAINRGRELGLSYVFACTTSERAAAFFARNGFKEMDHDSVPDEKWVGYDEQRKTQVRCFVAEHIGS